MFLLQCNEASALSVEISRCKLWLGRWFCGLLIVIKKGGHTLHWHTRHRILNIGTLLPGQPALSLSVKLDESKNRGQSGRVVPLLRPSSYFWKQTEWKQTKSGENVLKHQLCSFTYSATIYKETKMSNNLRKKKIYINISKD